MTAYTPNFQLPYLEPLQPVRDTRAVLEEMTKAMDAALTRGGVAPPEAQDLVALAGRVTTVEDGRARPRVTVRRATPQAVPGSVTTPIGFDSVTSRSTPGMWSSTNPTRLLVPETGEYDLSIAVTWNISPNPGALVIGYTVNGGGATWLDLRPSQTFFSAWQAAPLRGIDLAAGSYLEVIGLQNSDPSRQLVAGSTATLELARR